MELKMYSITDLTSILNLHSKTILRFIHEGKIKARKIGRSWMVSEEDLKIYCHGELSAEQSPVLSPEYDTLKDRISVSAVVEINEQNSVEASRISNSIMAMLNSNREPDKKFRFDHFYYPEVQKSKYVFYGDPGFIGKILEIFEILSIQKA